LQWYRFATVSFCDFWDQRRCKAEKHCYKAPRLVCLALAWGLSVDESV
jgi:hypothetical protein